MGKSEFGQGNKQPTPGKKFTREEIFFPFSAVVTETLGFEGAASIQAKLLKPNTSLKFGPDRGLGWELCPCGAFFF